MWVMSEKGTLVNLDQYRVVELSISGGVNAPLKYSAVASTDDWNRNGEGWSVTSNITLFTSEDEEETRKFIKALAFQMSQRKELLSNEGYRFKVSVSE